MYTIQTEKHQNSVLHKFRESCGKDIGTLVKLQKYLAPLLPIRYTVFWIFLKYTEGKISCNWAKTELEILKNSETSVHTLSLWNSTKNLKEQSIKMLKKRREELTISAIAVPYLFCTICILSYALWS